MGLPRPAGYPAHRVTARWVFDVLVTLAAVASAVPAAMIHDNARPQLAAIVVLAVGATPLLVRRIWPVPVFGVVLAVNAAAGLAGHDHALNGAALLIALYTVAAMRSRRDALACTALLELAVIAGLVVFAGGTWWYDAIFVSGMVAAALGLGLYSATRRAYLAELHDRAQRLERERDQQGALAAAAERTRIAREMHDIVAHHLTVMVTLSDAAVAASAASPERAAEVMRSVSSTGRRALADTRRLLGVLRQPPGESLQPVPGLAQLDLLIDQVRSAGLDTTLEIHGAAPDMTAGAQLTVYRLVQEALTNTLKHGGAGARAAVRLEFLPGELRLHIDDDGAGAAAPASASIGSGLAGMQERVRAYDGDVQAGPRRPGGWRVAARLHLDGGDAP
ncbi:MAG: histidine kinase [Streptosporangiaceae bacterium]|jgi:signal transduction histidine kinase